MDEKRMQRLVLSSIDQARFETQLRSTRVRGGQPTALEQFRRQRAASRAPQAAPTPKAATGALERRTAVPRALERRLDHCERRSRGAQTLPLAQLSRLRPTSEQLAYPCAVVMACMQQALAGSGHAASLIGVFAGVYALQAYSIYLWSAAAAVACDSATRSWLLDRGTASVTSPSAPKQSRPPRLHYGQLKLRHQAGLRVDRSLDASVFDPATGLAVLPKAAWQSDAWWKNLAKNDDQARCIAKFAATYARHEGQARLLTKLSLEQQLFAARAEGEVARHHAQATATGSGQRPNVLQRATMAVGVGAAALVLGSAVGIVASLVVYAGAYALFGLLTAQRAPDARAKACAEQHAANAEVSRGHAERHAHWAQRLSDAAKLQQAQLRELCALREQLA